jgi:hypothetical protein
VCFELREPARNGGPTIRAGEKVSPESNAWVGTSLTADQRRRVCRGRACLASESEHPLLKCLDGEGGYLSDSPASAGILFGSTKASTPGLAGMCAPGGLTHFVGSNGPTGEGLVRKRNCRQHGPAASINPHRGLVPRVDQVSRVARRAVVARIPSDLLDVEAVMRFEPNPVPVDNADDRGWERRSVGPRSQ